MCKLQTAIRETKAQIFRTVGIMPEFIWLPFNLYFRLIYSLNLHDTEGFDGQLIKYEGMKVTVFWKNEDIFTMPILCDKTWVNYSTSMDRFG